jgi:hypothetical protein
MVIAVRNWKRVIDVVIELTAAALIMKAKNKVNTAKVHSDVLEGMIKAEPMICVSAQWKLTA